MEYYTERDKEMIDALKDIVWDAWHSIYVFCEEGSAGLTKEQRLKQNEETNELFGPNRDLKNIVSALIAIGADPELTARAEAAVEEYRAGEDA